MSDNEDLLADDLGDHSLADYNLGNDEEDELLADDFDSGSSQNVPTSAPNFTDAADSTSSDYSRPYNNQQRIHYTMQPDTECVVPNITVEVPNVERATYAPYEPPQTYQEHAVPPAIPAAAIESPQMVPAEMAAAVPPESSEGARSRFVSERPPGQRTPQVRDIPDSLDKVVVPRAGGGGVWSRGRVWRNPQLRGAARYRGNHHIHRGNFNQRPSFPSPQKMRPHSPQMRPDMRPNPPLRPDIRPDIPPLRPDLPIRPDLGHPGINPDLPPNIPQMRPDLPIGPNMPIRPDMPIRPNMPIRPDFHPDHPNIPQLGPDMSEPLMPMNEPFRPMDMRPPFPRFQEFRPNVDARPFFPYQRPFRPFTPIREVTPNINQIPQVTIRHAPPNQMLPAKQEVRMLPLQLPPNLPPGGLQGKKVLINPHFKGNFQPVEGPVKDIDDAAERFIAEQRSALARAAGRKIPSRSPQRFIENNTIEIENELARGPWKSDDDDLLRRQEEFIHANRAGLRRRMRSPTPPRRSPSPRRSPDRPDRSDRPDRPDRRPRVDSRPANDEDSEYRRRMREQEALRERVMRAKEARRRKNAVAVHKVAQDRDRDREKEPAPPPTPAPLPLPRGASPAPAAPDTTRSSPDKVAVRERSPVKKEEVEVNSTCESLTPPPPSPRALTPPLPAPAHLTRTDSDDDLDLILGDIDGILSDDEDSGRFKEKASKSEPPKQVTLDLRAKLPPKPAEKRPPRQKIVFHSDREEKKTKEKSPVRRTTVTSSTKTNENVEKKPAKAKEKEKVVDTSKDKSRPRITFGNKEPVKPKEEETKPQFSNRRVILQRKVSQQTNEKSVFTRIEVKSDLSKPNPGIFSRAVRTAIGNDKNRIVVKKEEPQIEYESSSDVDEGTTADVNTAIVSNLPHGMTDTRLKTLAGSDVQSLSLDKEERTAKITFKSSAGAETFKRKFNNKMVAASRLTVDLH